MGIRGLVGSWLALFDFAVYDALTMRARTFVVLTALAGAACGTPLHGDTAGGSDSGGPVMVDLDVAGLEDVNATSASFGQTLHPSDFTGRTTAWYFGHST